MSKAVRIREHLYVEIERLAREERRSLIAQLEVLLEQALALEPSRNDSGAAGERPPSADAERRDLGTRVSAPDSHFRPDFK